MASASLLKFFIIFGLVHINAAVRCYICHSRVNPGCQDPINIFKMELTDCTPEVVKKSSSELAHAFNGVKSLDGTTAVDLVAGTKYDDIRYAGDNMQCQKMSFNLGKEVVIVRGCQVVEKIRPMDTRSPCVTLEDYIRSEPDSYMNFCDTCNHNGCNSAPGPHLPSPLTLLSPSIMAIVLALSLR